MEALNSSERKFAEENHGLIYSFLNFRKKAMENGYGASVGVAPALLSSDYNGPKVVIEERSTPPPKP